MDGSRKDPRQGRRAKDSVDVIMNHIFSSIRDRETDEDIWDELERMHQPEGRYKEVSLLDELTGMEGYLRKKIGAAQQL